LADDLTITINEGDITVPQWAKETTQVEIRNLLSGKGPGKSFGKDLEKAGKAAGGFDKSLKSAIPGPTKMAAGALEAAESLMNFGTTVIQTALTTKGSLTDLNAVIDAGVDVFDATIGQIPILGKVLSFFVGQAAEVQKMVNSAFEDLAVNFEQASKSGASFGGSITDFAAKSLDANMRLDTFNGIIAQNNETFARLGGTVSDGARRFMTLNKLVTESTDGVVTNFRGLGLTLQDVAELNADILEINSRNFAFQRLDAPAQAEIMKTTIARFATLGRLTGKRADQIAEEIKANTMRGDVAASLAGMNDKQRQSFEDLSVMLGQFGPNFAEAGSQMLAIGTATGDAALAFATTGSDLGGLSDVVKMIEAGADPDDVRARIAELEGSLRETVGSETSLSVARLASVSTTAGTAASAFESAANLIASTAESTDRFKTAVQETTDALSLEGDSLTASILGTKAELEGLGLEVNEKFVKLLTGEGGLAKVLEDVQAVQKEFVKMLNDFINPLLEQDEAAAKAKIEENRQELMTAGQATLSEREVPGYLFGTRMTTDLDTSKLITEAGSPGGSRGQNMEKARNAKLIRETVLEELGQADVDKSGSISESESKVLIDSLNTMIEQNEDLKKIMNKVDRDLLKGIGVTFE
tara:strand:- start:316 stop:2241 length:1926 start_codon:yes stop_codon:yes gene_type:complete